MKKGVNHPENKKPEQTGSPSTGEPVFLVVGLLRRSHGLKGDVVMDVYTDFPERLSPGKTVYIGDNHRPMIIRNARSANKELIIGFEGYQIPEETGDLRNQLVYVTAGEIPALPEGEYYHHQLIGLRVVDTKGTLIGNLVEILETGANDVYIVKSASGTEMLIPAVDEFVLEINMERGEMVVAPPNWE